MRTRAGANIKHSSGTESNGDFVQFGKAIRVKELSRINRRISDAVITPQDAVSIFFAVQIIEHRLSVKFHLRHFVSSKLPRSFPVIKLFLRNVEKRVRRAEH